MPDLEDIRAFVAVLDAGGLSRAADRLGVSKSVISRRIGRLEEGLGTRLIHRTTRGLSPTEAGAEFKVRGERILADLDEAVDVVARQQGEIAGRLRVALPLSFGVRHVAPLLADLARAHPRLEIEAAYSDRYVDLVAERFDCALRVGRLADSSLIARRIAPIHSVLVASPAYLARAGTPATPEDLAGHDGLIYTGGSDRDVWHLKVGRRTVTVRPRARFFADSGDALMTAAIAGLGIAPIPRFLVSEAVEAGQIVPVLHDCSLPEAALHAVRPPGPHVPARVRLFFDAVTDRFGHEPDWDRCAGRIRAAELAAVERAAAVPVTPA